MAWEFIGHRTVSRDNDTMVSMVSASVDGLDIQPGDVLLWIHAFRRSSDTEIDDPAGGAFEPLFGVNSGESGNDWRFQVFARICNGAETGTFTFTLGNETGPAIGTLLCYRGISIVPRGRTAAAASTTAASSTYPDAVTDPADLYMNICVWPWRQDGGGWVGPIEVDTDALPTAEIRADDQQNWPGLSTTPISAINVWDDVVANDPGDSIVTSVAETASQNGACLNVIFQAISSYSAMLSEDVDLEEDLDTLYDGSVDLAETVQLDEQIGDGSVALTFAPAAVLQLSSNTPTLYRQSKPDGSVVEAIVRKTPIVIAGSRIQLSVLFTRDRVPFDPSEISFNSWFKPITVGVPVSKEHHEYVEDGTIQRHDVGSYSIETLCNTPGMLRLTWRSTAFGEEVNVEEVIDVQPRTVIDP